VGKVDLHRPRINDPEFKELSPAEASTAYRQVLASIAAYLDEMEVPKPIIESMIGTSSDDIRWVESDGDGLERPPSIAEWEDAPCGSHVSINLDNATPQQIAEFGKKSDCVSDLLSSHRARLAPP
jgi:hypothetical protein